MSQDEIIVSLVCLGLGLLAWGRWYWQVLAVARFGARLGPRKFLYAAPFLCAGALFFILKTEAAHDVRDDPVYLAFYLLMGAAWLGVAAHALSFFGLSARDDVIERGNGAAGLAIGGALLGLTFCFAGGNIGDGPGWWVVAFSGLLATGAISIAWWLAAVWTDWVDRITIDRDLAAGIRSAGFFLGAGLILGRAAAGDWQSAAATVKDFAINGWPILPLLGAALVIERLGKPEFTDFKGALTLRGWFPAALYLGIGAVTVAMAWPLN
jgi:hypothetical protein